MQSIIFKEYKLLLFLIVNNPFETHYILLVGKFTSHLRFSGGQTAENATFNFAKIFIKIFVKKMVTKNKLCFNV